MAKPKQITTKNISKPKQTTDNNIYKSKQTTNKKIIDDDINQHYAPTRKDQNDKDFWNVNAKENDTLERTTFCIPLLYFLLLM